MRPNITLYSLLLLPPQPKALPTFLQAEMLSWVAQGKTNPEIAILCDISERTVQKHLEHIFQKMGVETRTAAAQRALTAEKYNATSGYRVF